MFNRSLLALAGLAFLPGLPTAGAGGNKDQSLLQVIRLKPGETRSVELALAHGQFRRAFGRDSLKVEVLPPGSADQKPIAVKAEVDKDKGVTGRYLVSADLVVVWRKAGVEFQASKDAKPGTTDLRLVYNYFGQAHNHAAEFRVVVEK